MPLPPRLAVAAVLAAAGVVAGGYYLWPKARHIASCPPLHAPVPAAAKTALAAYAGRIQYEIDHMKDGGRDESWSDPLSGNRRQVELDYQGKVTSEFATITLGRVAHFVTVSFGTRTWLSERQPLSFAVHPVANEAASIAQGLRDLAARGKITVIGHETIGGRATLHLRQIVHPGRPKLPKGFSPPKGFHFPAMPAFRVDTWVDPLTYLPVRTTTFGSTTDESWIARTPANVAKTKLVIPPGFRHVVPQQSTNVATGRLLVSTSSGCQ